MLVLHQRAQRILGTSGVPHAIASWILEDRSSQKARVRVTIDRDGNFCEEIGRNRRIVVQKQEMRHARALLEIADADVRPAREASIRSSSRNHEPRNSFSLSESPYPILVCPPLESCNRIVERAVVYNDNVAWGRIGFIESLDARHCLGGVVPVDDDHTERRCTRWHFRRLVFELGQWLLPA